MPTSPLSVVIQHLLADVGPDGGGMTDGELLARFLRSRDDDALAALVRRHAAMVWGVCCRLLRNQQDAEDAFQATFLVLVRRAAYVPRQAVANWLHGVARQTAVRLRATTAKRGRRERQVVNMPEPTVAEARDTDWQSALDEELSRLPEHYRGVIVLCDLEGMTRKEAARQLGIPEGSVASRLARARAMLAKRLTRRGTLFSIGSASVPPALVASTIQAASLDMAGQAVGVVSAKVAALTEGVVKAMFVTKTRSVLAVVLLAAAVVAAVGVSYRSSAAEQPAAKAEPFVARKDRNSSDERQVRANPPVQPKQPARTDQERMVGGWIIVNDDSRQKGEVWQISMDEITMNANLLGFRVYRHFHRLDPTRNPRQIDITVTKTNREFIGVIKGIYALEARELRLCLGEIGKDRPAAFPVKPKPGEVLILHGGPEDKAPGDARKKKEKLRMLIDKVLEAHGGKVKLDKLQFTMTVKHSNGVTVQYLIQPPDHFRSEEQQRGEATKLVTILFHNHETTQPGIPMNGRMWWKKHPNGQTKRIIFTGAERTMEYWLDHVKFFGPRRVLRLKDADHRVTLLDEEIKIDGRAAVGVEATGPQFKGRMYFDKQTHLLVKSGAVTYSDYKKFDGIPVAQKENDGYLMPQVTDFRAVKQFDAKLFEQP
jgi:RNA polymerase sigma factor (sigma-70 family)